MTEKEGKALKTNKAGKYDLFLALIDEKDGVMGLLKGIQVRIQLGILMDGKEINGKVLLILTG